MEGYRSFAVTVQGGSHIKSGVDCQDVSTFFDDESVSIAVVADGHGDSNCFRSDSGAKFAVECATKGIKQFVKEHEALFKQSLIKKSAHPSHRELEKLLREKLIRQIVASWNKLVMDDCQSRPFTAEELEKASEKYRERYNKDNSEKYENGKYINKAYGTSLIAAAITPWYWFAYHIGDGRFSVLYKNSEGDQPVPWDPKCYLNVTTSICDDDILDRGEEGVRLHLSMKAEKEPPVAFFLCSDGIDDNYPADEKENATQLYRLYREIAVTFAEDGYESTCGKDGISGQIKDLANNFATKGKGDDTSLAGIVNIDELKKVAPKWREKMAADEEERKKAKVDAAEKAKAETEEREKATKEAAARKETKRAEREAEKAEAEADKRGENADDKGDSKAPDKSEDLTSKDKAIQVASVVINAKQAQQAKKIDILA